MFLLEHSIGAFPSEESDGKNSSRVQDGSPGPIDIYEGGYYDLSDS